MQREHEGTGIVETMLQRPTSSERRETPEKMNGGKEDWRDE